MSENFDVIAIFLINAHFGAILKQDSWCIVCKTYFSLIVPFYPKKNWKHNSEISNTNLTLLLWVKVLFWPKNTDFLQKMLTSARLRGPWYKKVYFLKLHMIAYLRAKFQVSSIILTSFRQGVIPPTPSPQNEHLKSPPKLVLKNIKPTAKFSLSEIIYHPDINKAPSPNKDLLKDI